MVSKRTQNAALIRYRLINYLIDSCRTRKFADIHVVDICRAANISKVTFFKYFDQKEDLLLLYKSILNTGICIDVSQKELSSIAGLEFIIERFVSILRDTPTLANELITTLLHTQLPILPVLLTESDRSLFFPDVRFAEVNVISFFDLVEGFMLEGILSKEITRMSSPPELANIFVANLYGAIVTSQIRSNSDRAILFNNITKSCLKTLT